MELFMSTKLLFYLKFLIFLLLLLLSGTENSQITRCREKERQALAMFKEGLTDKSGLLSSWQTRDCCEWKEVRCSNLTGHVIALHLSPKDQEYSLRGKVSPSLLELEYLTYLDLSRYNGSLKRLKYLDLSRGSFAGEIPIQLGNLSNLQYLDLSYNFGYLSIKNLNWLSDLSSLRYLNLSKVNLSMAHDWTKAIDRLPFLQELILDDCELPGITLTKFSPSSFNFSRSIIFVLDLSDNNFGIELSRFHWLLNHSSTLTEIDLFGSGLIGGIPHDFGKMHSLEYLVVSRSKLEGELTNSIGNISTLKLLDLSINKFNGRIPPSILKLPKLETLRMRQNLFQGELPEFLSSSPLIELDLSFNKLSGCFHLHNLSKLRHLELSHNSLNLELNSDWVPNCLDLSSNHFSGTVPNCLMQLNKLLYLNLGSNKFSGKVPSSIGQLTQIQSLNLRKNSLDGQLPPSLQQRKLLRVIDFGHNKFRGKIPYIFKSPNK